MMNEERAKAMGYSCGPVQDCKWENKEGRKGSWRGPSWQAQHAPTGPKLKWGSRLGASMNCKGVYFGNPGLPRFTYATTKVSPSLGPAMGIPKAEPEQVSKPFPKEMCTHLEERPAAFVLEGVVGYNPVKAREIRKLREQLVTVDAVYVAEDQQLRKQIRSSQHHLEINQKDLHAADIRRRDKEQKKEELLRELREVRQMIDDQAVQIRQQKKAAMRAQLQAVSEEM